MKCGAAPARAIRARRTIRTTLYTTLTLAGLVMANTAFAHAVVGDRTFPATMAVDDPGVGDEFDVQYGHIKSPGDDGGNVNVNTFSYEWDKLITSRLAISIGGNYTSQNAPDGGSVKGWDNPTIGIKYMLYQNAEHEFMASVGLEAELGGTGAHSVANSYSTITPSAYFGKGFGDLPASLSYLRPFAITGEVGPNFTTARQAQNSVDWGMTLQYSIPYLQSEVKDLGLPKPFANLVPVVEFPMNTCTGSGCSGPTTTGTINPGLLYMTRWGQFGIEGQIPVNRGSGTHTGILLQAHLYFDDIFPKTLGAPLIRP